MPCWTERRQFNEQVEESLTYRSEFLPLPNKRKMIRANNLDESILRVYATTDRGVETHRSCQVFKNAYGGVDLYLFELFIQFFFVFEIF